MTDNLTLWKDAVTYIGVAVSFLTTMLGFSLTEPCYRIHLTGTTFCRNNVNLPGILGSECQQFGFPLTIFPSLITIRNYG